MIFLGLRVLVVPAGPGMNVLTCGLVDALRLHIEEPGREIDAGELFDLLFLKEGLGDKFLAMYEIHEALLCFFPVNGEGHHEIREKFSADPARKHDRIVAVIAKVAAVVESVTISAPQLGQV